MRTNPLAWAPPYYFLFYAAAAALLPFLVLYYQDLGLTGTEIGLLAAIPSIVSLFSAPIWGAISDVTHQHKLSLLVTMMGAILMALILAGVKSFVWLISAVGLFAFFASPIMPLVDYTTMKLLGRQKMRYGRLRLWGSIGWGIAAPVVGRLVESGGIILSFWSYAGLMALGILIAVRIPVSGQMEIDLRKGVRTFLSSPAWIVFLVVAFCGGVVLSVISNFLFIFLRDLGANEALLGLTLTFGTISELPVMYFSGRLLHRYRTRQLMLAAVLLFAVRVLAYSFIKIPWVALLIQLLHGPSFSLMWLAGVSYADEIAPAGLGSAAQGLFSGVMLGIGAAAGAFLGGLLYDHVGLVNTFRLTALCTLFAFGVMFLVDKGNDGQRLRYSGCR